MQNSYGVAHTCPFTAPVTLTTAYNVVTTARCVIEYLAFANYDASDATVTMQSGDGHTFLPGITVTKATTTTVQIPDGGLYFPQGFQIKSSNTSLIDAWFRYRAV